LKTSIRTKYDFNILTDAYTILLPMKLEKIVRSGRKFYVKYLSKNFISSLMILKFDFKNKVKSLKVVDFY